MKKQHRNLCALNWQVAGIIVAILMANPASSADAERERHKPTDKPRFTVVQGKGWSVCERYVRFLNAQPETEVPPLCHLKQSPELKEPDWEALDIQAHLHTIYSIEYPPYRNATNPDKPPPSFDRWQKEFRQRQTEGQSPRLRRTRLALVDDGPVETILAYEADRNRCDRMVQEKGYSHWGDGVGLVLWDEQLGKISDYRSMLTFVASPSRLLLFQGRPFMFLTAWGDVLVPPANKVHVGGRIGVHHFFFVPGDSDPYGHMERCQIGFDLPANIVERMTK